MNTLFGYIATLVSNREDIATKALHYVLQNSQAARTKMGEIAQIAQPQLPPLFTFDGWPSSKSGEGRPDMRGVAADGTVPLLIENKLWAGLTQHQPVTYFKQLPTNGLLLFIVPDIRKSTLRLELEVGIKKFQSNYASNWSHNSNFGLDYQAPVDGKALAVITWDKLLDALEHAVARETGAFVTSHDLKQLRGFVQSAGGVGDEFAPFRSEDVSGRDIPKMLISSQLIIDSVCKGLVDFGFGGWKDWSKSFLYYGKSFSFRDFLLHFGFFHHAWKLYGGSPLWCGVNYENPKRHEIHDALSRLMGNSQADLHPIDLEESWYMPIFLEANAPQDEVTRRAVEQIRQIRDALAQL